jgi:hypothetical protein
LILFFLFQEIPSDDQYETLEDSELTELEMIIEAEFEVGCILRVRKLKATKTLMNKNIFFCIFIHRIKLFLMP